MERVLFIGVLDIAGFEIFEVAAFVLQLLDEKNLHRLKNDVFIFLSRSQTLSALNLLEFFSNFS